MSNIIRILHILNYYIENLDRGVNYSDEDVREMFETIIKLVDPDEYCEEDEIPSDLDEYIELHDP